MREISLSNGKAFALVDDEDFDYLNKFTWYLHSGGYAYTNRFQGANKPTYMHRLIMKTPPGINVDHIDMGRLNNQKINLRNCTVSENQQNTIARKKTKIGITSNYKGVNWHDKSHKWRAYIVVDGKHKHLGCYEDEKMAAVVYNFAALRNFGEFARFNEIAA